MANRLNDETSPYLRQHADNPVEWYPWGDEAFDLARTNDRPILLSIGYSACHWCHVMAHESFEDPATAGLMNRHFVNIKVDREEHPDVDQIYQHALQLFGEHGGWPLTMFLTPAGEPFYGGTYFPPRDNFGRPAFRRVLEALSQSYRDQREDVVEQARRLVEALGKMEARGQGESGRDRPPGDLAERAAAKLALRMDSSLGGFQGAPKFPNPTSLALQLRASHRSGRAEDARPVLLTLTKMAEGGIYDQLGGGFARYSTDEKWLVPHFEKMLYDNAQLLRLYADGYNLAMGEGRTQQAALYEKVIRETLGWIEREMRDPAGGLYAAQDADSEGVEGKYFVWTPDEVEALCGREAGAVLMRCYDVRPGGNWNDPHGHGPRGASILHVVDAPRDGREEQLLAQARAQLLLARRLRVPPGTDDKVLTGWNGLCISGMAEAARILGLPEAASAARRTADFLLAQLRTPQGKLLRTYKQGVAKLPATLDDHAFLAEGLFHLAGATGDVSYLEEARRLTEATLETLYDRETGSFYLAPLPEGKVPMVQRPLSLFDSAIPSGLSVTCMNLLRLWELLLPSCSSYREVAEQTLLRHWEQGLKNPFGLSNLCSALDLLQHGLTITVIVHPAEGDGGAVLRAAAARAPVPDPFVLVVPAEGAKDLPEGLKQHVQGKHLVDGKAAAYVCRQQSCSAPVTEAGELVRLLGAGRAA